MQRSAIAVLLSVALLGGCVVGKQKYEDALGELSTRESQLAQLQQQYTDLEAANATLDQTLNETQMSLQQCQALSRDLQAQLESTESDLSRCRSQLADTESLLDAQSAEAQDLMARLEQLALVEEELRQRNAFFQQFLQQFEELIEAGLLEVRIERGRVVLGLPQDILFDTGSAQLGPEGSETLTQIGQVLATIDRRFQVEGHTDNVPISTSRFPSNWELSAARALSVVHLFVGAGVPPENLSAAAFGEFQPRASNATPEDRTLNRRIEIVLVPNLEVFSDEI